MTNRSSGSGIVPTHEEFCATREISRAKLRSDDALHELALELQMAAAKHQFGYQWEWAGVPIIRLPDDIVLFQEIVWRLRPAAIVETGVARGGSVLLSASLMAMAGIEPKVLGLDLEIHPHTHEAIRNSLYGNAITLWQGDSSSDAARAEVQMFISQNASTRPVVLALDSDHTHAHVLAELRQLTQTLPSGSVVAVADTIIEEMPQGYYADRSWDRGNSPATAIREFLMEEPSFSLDASWNRRSLVSEFRDGILVRR